MSSERIGPYLKLKPPLSAQILCSAVNKNGTAIGGKSVICSNRAQWQVERVTHCPARFKIREKVDSDISLLVMLSRYIRLLHTLELLLLNLYNNIAQILLDIV